MEITLVRNLKKYYKVILFRGQTSPPPQKNLLSAKTKHFQFSIYYIASNEIYLMCINVHDNIWQSFQSIAIIFDIIWIKAYL